MNIQRQAILYRQWLSVGEHTYGDKITIKRGNAKITIGKYCSIADNITMYLGYEHNTKIFTTYPIRHFFKVGNEHQGRFLSSGDIVIGNDVWIGSNVIIMSNVKIGNGAVIGAYSVVAKDIPEYAVAVGNPVVVKHKRFDDETIELLLKMQWWNWPDDKVKKHADILTSNDVESLKRIANE